MTEDHDNRESTELETLQQQTPPPPPLAENEEGGTEKDASDSLHETGGGSPREEVDDDDEYAMENQEWANDSSDKCNLIVNYLPHEIDDTALKVCPDSMSYQSLMSLSF